MAKFFDDFGERISQTAETVTERAGEIVEITRLKNQIRRLEQENKKDLKELGNFVYEQYKGKKKLPEKFEAICEAMEERDKGIEDCREKAAELKRDRTCPTCGRHSPKNTLYCPFCGTKLFDDLKEGPADIKEKAEDMGKKVKEKAEDIAEKVKEKAEDLAGKAKEKAEGLTEKAKEKAEDLAEKAKEKAEGFTEKVKEKAEGLMEKVKEKTGDLSDRGEEGPDEDNHCDKEDTDVKE